MWQRWSVNCLPILAVIAGMVVGIATTAFPAESVSIVSLIAHPEKYDGKHVIVTGFLALDFEGSAIYLHQDDYEHSIYKNGLWYAGNMVKYRKFDKKYVNVEGTFDGKNKGHLGLWSGAIKDIKRMWEPVRPGKPEGSDTSQENPAEDRPAEPSRRQIDVVVTGHVVPAVVKVGQPIPLKIRITNGLKWPIRFQTYRMQPVEWNGETINISLVDIYRNGKKFNLYFARPEVRFPYKISGSTAYRINPGEALEVNTDASKWKLRDGWLSGRYQVTVRADALLVDDYSRLHVMSDPFEFQIK